MGWWCGGGDRVLVMISLARQQTRECWCDASAGAASLLQSSAGCRRAFFLLSLSLTPVKLLPQCACLPDTSGGVSLLASGATYYHLPVSVCVGLANYVCCLPSLVLLRSKLQSYRHMFFAASSVDSTGTDSLASDSGLCRWVRRVEVRRFKEGIFAFGDE